MRKPYGQFCRDRLSETPTFTGGVNKEARDQIHSRLKKRDSHGLYQSSLEDKQEKRYSRKR